MIHEILKQPDGRYTVVFTAKDGRRYVQTDFVVDHSTVLTNDSATMIVGVLESLSPRVRGD